MLILKKDETEELISVCRKLTSEINNEFEKHLNFFKLISLINNASVPDRPHSFYPNIIVNAMSYINDNLAYSLTITEISSAVNVSINTLERYFARYLGISPTAYIRKIRLSNGAKLLSEGYSVTEASENSGFSNCSAFIALFKKAYGQTPYAYKKNYGKLLTKQFTVK